MFPIPSGRTLSLIDIAKYWSREIKPSASPHELRDTLSRAWWRGELVAANGPSRVDALRALHSKCADDIAFVAPGTPEPLHSRLLDDGGVKVCLSIRVPLPNAEPDTWTDTNCAEAYTAIAEAWDEKAFNLLTLEVPFIVLSQSEFIQWTKKCGYTHPTFWGNASADDDEREHTDNTVPRITITKIQPKTEKSNAAWRGIRHLWPDGPPKDLATSEIHRKVNRWLGKPVTVDLSI